MLATDRTIAVKLRANVSCPHCWHDFSPEETFWVAEHGDLIGDIRSGDKTEKIRFLPTRYNADGNAIDPGGIECHRLACPHCHLIVPRSLFEMTPLFASIMGAPSCGKTYFLASMTWQLRQVMPKSFAVSFGDADPESNTILNDYEEDLFLSANPDEVVKLDKTKEYGVWYDKVQFDSGEVQYPKPFLFIVRPLNNHPQYTRAAAISRIVCLYDNAGESFLPGTDLGANPVTRHLSQSRALFFLFDPTQDPRFRRACAEVSSDVQIQDPKFTARQETVLHEVATRIRRATKLGHNQKCETPLIVIVTKFDAWWPLFGQQWLDPPWSAANNGLCQLDVKTIDSVSDKVRSLLWSHCPEMVSAVEGFAQQVVYVPVSATGCAPVSDPESGIQRGVRPKDMRPMWTEVPMLLTLCRYESGIIAGHGVTTKLPSWSDD
jgi:hypothetical protein